MPINHAAFAAEFKALPDAADDRGRFEAIVSVFGNEDAQGDRVIEGAFAKSLKKWQEVGHPIPVIFSHDWSNPFAHIGSAEPSDVVEVKGHGLKVVGSIDVDTNPLAAQVYHLMKKRQLKEFSFGYAVRNQRRAKDGVNELLDLDIIEVGPTLKGANPSTELLSIKSQLEEAAAQDDPVIIGNTIVSGGHGIFLEKAGRSISSKNESRIRVAVESLTEVLASLGGADEETAEDADEAKVKTEEPKVVDPGLSELQARIINLKE